MGTEIKRHRIFVQGFILTPDPDYSGVSGAGHEHSDCGDWVLYRDHQEVVDKLNDELFALKELVNALAEREYTMLQALKANTRDLDNHIAFQARSGRQ